VPIVLNARCDIFHLQHGEEGTRFAATVERCKSYLAAGADCVYPFGVRDPATIAAFVEAVGAPVNITGRPGMPDAAVFERIGVARITIASAATLVAMSAIQKNVPDEVFAFARARFSEEELVKLTLAIVAINGANRINVAFRAVPGNYRPSVRRAAE